MAWGDTPQPREGSAPPPPGEEGAPREGSAPAPPETREGAAPRQGTAPARPEWAGAPGRGEELAGERSPRVMATFAVLAAAYAGTTLLSALLSPLPAIAFWGSYLRGEGTVATLAYAVLFLVVADRLRRREQLDRLVNVLLATSLPICVYAVAQGTGHDPFAVASVAGRAVATAGNPIFLGAYLIMLVPLTVWRLLDDPRRRAEALTWQLVRASGPGGGGDHRRGPV